MNSAHSNAVPPPNDPPRDRPTDVPRDGAGLRDAHDRTGRMFQQAGLPFEDDEFDDEGPAPVEDAGQDDGGAEQASGETRADEDAPPLD